MRYNQRSLIRFFFFPSSSFPPKFSQMFQVLGLRLVIASEQSLGCRLRRERKSMRCMLARFAVSPLLMDQQRSEIICKIWTLRTRKFSFYTLRNFLILGLVFCTLKVLLSLGFWGKKENCWFIVFLTWNKL